MVEVERRPLDEAALRRGVLVPGGIWSELRVVAQTASTNAELVAAARGGAPEGAILVADQQTAGRGRLGRSWESPPRAGLAVSVLLRPSDPVPDRGWPGVPVARYAWLPLLAGVALVDVVRGLGGVDAVLKWPNDLLVGAGRGKCAGILADLVPGPGGTGAVVVGIGLNVSLRTEELPRPDATSLALEQAACLDRDLLLSALLRELADRYAGWRTAGGDIAALRADYLDRCDTLGRTVRASLPGDQELVGEATGVDAEGRLVLEVRGVRTPVAAGDIVHLR